MGAILMAYADALRITSDSGEIYDFAQQDATAPATGGPDPLPAENIETAAKPKPAPKPSVDPVPEKKTLEKPAPAPKPSVDPVPEQKKLVAPPPPEVLTAKKPPAPKPSVDPVPEQPKKIALPPQKLETTTAAPPAPKDGASAPKDGAPAPKAPEADKAKDCAKLKAAADTCKANKEKA